MKTILFNGLPYQCPEKWDEVTLEMQIKVSEDSKKFTNEASRKVAIISGYLNMNADMLKKANINDVLPLFKELEFINQPLEDKPIESFKFKGYEYFVGQNLMEMEFQDYASLENALNNNSGDVYQSLPYIVAILAKRKVKGEFESMDDYDVEKRAEEFKQLPITIAKPLSVFFYNNVNSYTILSQLYSNRKDLLLNHLKSVEDTLNRRVGRGLLTRLLIGILRIYLRFIRRSVRKHYTSTQVEYSTTKPKMK